MSQRLCRRTECQQDSPHTLLLYQRRRRRRRRRRRSAGADLLLCHCARRSTHHLSSSDSRNDYHPKSAVSTVSFPSDSSVSHCDMNCSSPHNLPVTATSQTSHTQQLTEAVESFWMIRIWLVLSVGAHFLVVV